MRLASVVVLGYKQERYIRDAVRSALAQTYENLEIILSDDASPDRTFDIMKEEAAAYRGPHRLILNRNPVNLGLTGNLSRAMQLASGDLIVEQDGDDISLPVRVSKLVQRWLSDEPHCDLVFSREIRIGADGEVLEKQNVPLPVVTLKELIRGRFFIAGGCVSSYSRSLFERFGPMSPAIRYTDFAMTFRALLGSGCAFIDEPLVYYRIHPESIVQKARKVEGSRRGQAERARDNVVQMEDMLKAWDLSGKRDLSLRWRLVRNLGSAKLDACSSSGTRFAALGCLIRAVGTGRLNSAQTCLRRDLLSRDSD